MNRIKDYAKLATDITNWIRQYANDNNIQSLVVGVSGGIDSAVVSGLCAMTGLPVYCCIIEIHSSKKCMSLASNHIYRLQATSEYKVRSVFRNLDRVLMEYREGGRLENPHVLANTKSRLRMAVLYEIAALNQGIVVGTGNKVEDFGIGFMCKGGDSQVDISPIADLYKTEVWALGRYLGIDSAIIDATPTDDLFLDGRTDEQQIGCTYEELEWAMENVTMDLKWVRLPNIHDGLTDRQREIIDIYIKLNKQNQHKMIPIPIYKLPC